MKVDIWDSTLKIPVVLHNPRGVATVLENGVAIFENRP
jgi:hypothetical protein